MKKLLNIFLFLFAGYLLFHVWSIPANTVGSLTLQTLAGALVVAFMLVFADNFLPMKKKFKKTPFTIEEEKQLLQDILLGNPGVYEIEIKVIKAEWQDDYAFIEILVESEEIKKNIESICKAHDINSKVTIRVQWWRKKFKEYQ